MWGRAVALFSIIVAAFLILVAIIHTIATYIAGFLILVAAAWWISHPKKKRKSPRSHVDSDQSEEA